MQGQTEVVFLEHLTSTAQPTLPLACRHPSLGSLSERTSFLKASVVDNDRGDEDNGERVRHA